uniref:CSON009729 protein n=1 Tax=Culicoides sonorensis TaxID=179676 RepID=A0A336LKH3_CULSO
MKMPPMYHLDDYESCLFSTDKFSIFCVVHAIIKPDNSSSVYNQVIEFSSDTKKHFAHDLLYIGHCLKKCEKDLEKLSEGEMEDLYVEPFPWRLNRKWYETRNVYENTSLYRKLYDRKLNQCSNLWLRQNYNLSLQSTIEFCSTNQEITNQKYGERGTLMSLNISFYLNILLFSDYWHYIFLAVTLCITVIITSATYFDAKLNKSKSLEHYKLNLNKKLTNLQQYLLCFSIVRNWYRLTSQPNTEISRDLRCLNAFRYITKRRSLVYDISEDTQQNYFAPYINTGNYLLGVCGAMLYFHCKNAKINLGNSKLFIVIWYLTIPLAHIVLAVSGYIFYNYYFDLPSIWVSLTAVFVQNIWGVFATILVLGFSSKFRSPAKNFCNWSIFTPLSRLTYGIYVSHLTIVRPLLGQQMTLPYLSFSSLYVQMIALAVLCHIVALILCLTIEFPLTAIAKKVLKKQEQVKEYMKMPPMYHTDDYESCLFSTDELNIFCVVHAIIKPDNSSSVYNQVIEFSSDTKKHFAHDLLYIGHCLNKCEKDLEKLSEEEREDLYDEPFPWRLDRKCMGHLWYVAADTQLFIFTLFLCMIMFKFWKYRKQIFCATFIMSLVVHFTAHYVYGHDGIFLFTPEKRRSVVYDIDKALQQDYFPPYINTGNYLLGVLGAMLYFHSKKSKFNLGNSNLFIVIWYLTPSIGQIFLGITGFIFYKYYFDLPSIWVSLTAVFVQNIWGLFGIILVLGFSAKFKSKNFCNWPVFSPLSRLTYGIYLCHLSIVRPLLGQQKTLPYVSFSSLLVEMLALTVLCHIVALILCLLLEFPLTAIAKRVLRKNQDPLIELKIVKNHTDNNLNHITSHDQGDTLLPCKRNTDI